MFSIAPLNQDGTPDLTQQVDFSDTDVAIGQAFMDTQGVTSSGTPAVLDKDMKVVTPAVEPVFTPKFATFFDLLMDPCFAMLSRLRADPQFATADPTLAAAHQAVTDAQTALDSALTAAAPQLASAKIGIKPMPPVTVGKVG